MVFKPRRASVVFYVSDIVRTEKFYNETLNLGLERQEGADPFWLSGSLEDGLQIVFFQVESRRGETPALIFEVSDGGIDDIVTDLAAKGVTIVTPVSEAPGGWSAEMLDPDNFRLGLYQSGDKPRTLGQL